MKITKIISYLVEYKDEEYRTDGQGNWERFIYNEWVVETNEKGLEELFQKINSGKEICQYCYAELIEDKLKGLDEYILNKYFKQNKMICPNGCKGGI